MDKMVDLVTLVLQENAVSLGSLDLLGLPVLQVLPVKKEQMAKMDLMAGMVREEHQDSKAQLVNQVYKGDREKEELMGQKVTTETAVEMVSMVKEAPLVFRELLENLVSLDNRV